ncbi:pyruvate dehydrogenase (acetyl-transferring) kinase, mitochondrial, partial [Tanacetum coccineum]
QVMLRAFHMSLTRAASLWLRNKLSGSITAGEYMKTKFLSKYYPPARTTKKMEEINNFQQEPDENLYQAWERFKEFLIKFLQHYLTEMQEVVLFYNGLDFPTRQILDSRGAIPSKTFADAKVAIQEMAEYSQKWHNGTSRTRSIETSDGLAAIEAKLNNLGREIKKENEKVYVAQVGYEQCKGPYYTKDCPLKEEGKILEEVYYTQFGAPLQGGGYRATILGFFQRKSANPSYQEQSQSIEDTLSKFMSESAERHEEHSNLIKERGFGSLLSSTKTNSRDHVKLISTIVEADSYPIRHRTMKYPKGIAENMLVGIGKFVFLVDFIIFEMPEDIKVPLILGRPFLSTAHAKIDVFKWKITLRVGEERIIFKSVKPASSLIKRVYMLGLRERIELDLESRLMGETLVLNRSLDPFFEDYIELNDLNVPLKLRRDQVDDLMPTIMEGEVVAEFRVRNDVRMVSKNFGYPSHCDHDKKIRIDYAYNLKFSCMIDFAVLEDIDAYRDKGIGDVIFGEPFFREVRINTKRFEGMITIHNGNEEVTYQMVRSHLRFKHHTNKQCNKIPLLLKDLAERKEIDNVGGESTIRKFQSVGVLKPKTVVQHTSFLINSTWRTYRAKYQGSFSF